MEGSAFLNFGGSLKNTLALLVLAMASPMTLAEMGSPDLTIIQEMIAGPQPEGANCAGTALIGADLLPMPIFVYPPIMDLLKSACFDLVQAPSPGDLGAIISKGKSVHFYTFL